MVHMGGRTAEAVVVSMFLGMIAFFGVFGYVLVA